MKKLMVVVRLMEGPAVLEETSALYELNDVPSAPSPRATQQSGNTQGVVMQLRRVFRRELIRRNLIVAEPEDSARVR